MELGIAGRCAIITGASKGIGRAAAEQLGGEGVSLVVAARDGAALERARVELARTTAVVAVEADVLDRTSAARLRDTALDRFGRIDIVVNNAGGGGGPLASFDEDEWLEVYAKNVTSVVRLTMACLPTLQAQRWGRVINIASTSARHCDPRFGAYGAAKAALLHVTRNLAQAYSRDGVLVNCVLPGLTRTDGVLDRYDAAAEATGRDADDIERRMMERQPIAIGRTAAPAEIAAMVAFLCSEQASFVTGAEVLVDGGTITDI